MMFCSVVNMRQNEFFHTLSFLCRLLLRKLERRKKKIFTVHSTVYLIFNTQSDKEEVLLHVLQLVIETVRIPLEDVTGLITKPYWTFKIGGTNML